MKIIIPVMLPIIFLLSTVNISLAAEIKPSVKSASTTKILTIESKVTGSQEQPKVLYIMPWQGITNPITIKDKEAHLTLPNFQPINPKTFKKEVRDFAANQAKTQHVVK